MNKKSKTLRKSKIKKSKGKTYKMKGGFLEGLGKFLGVKNSNNDVNDNGIKEISTQEITNLNSNQNVNIKIDNNLQYTPNKTFDKSEQCLNALKTLQTGIKAKIAVTQKELKYLEQLKNKFKNWIEKSDEITTWQLVETDKSSGISLDDQKQAIKKLKRQADDLLEKGESESVNCKKITTSEKAKPITLTPTSPPATPVKVVDKNVQNITPKPGLPQEKTQSGGKKTRRKKLSK